MHMVAEGGVDHCTTHDVERSIISSRREAMPERKFVRACVERSVLRLVISCGGRGMQGEGVFEQRGFLRDMLHAVLQGDLVHAAEDEKEIIIFAAVMVRVRDLTTNGRCWMEILIGILTEPDIELWLRLVWRLDANHDQRIVAGTRRIVVRQLKGLLSLFRRVLLACGK